MDLHTSVVDFPTQTRAHIALGCADIEASVAFYTALFEREPTKQREGYAKFELHEPPLNLALNEVAGSHPPQPAPAHFGVQVKSTAAVVARQAQMVAKGFSSETEAGVGCCYAIQDKIWVSDPDGNRWEVFVVTEADIPEYIRTSAESESKSESKPDAEACCPPTCCT